MTLGPLMLDVEGLRLTSPEAERLRNPLVGGVILFSRNFRDIGTRCATSLPTSALCVIPRR